jgi:hypothetical protein
MAFRQDFESFLGEDITLAVTMSPVPSGGIAGWTLEFTARTPVINAAKYLEKLNAAFTIDDPDLGTFHVDIADTDTEVSPSTETVDYAYSIKRVDAGKETILVWGTWTLRTPATRDTN